MPSDFLKIICPEFRAEAQTKQEYWSFTSLQLSVRHQHFQGNKNKGCQTQIIYALIGFL